VTYTCERLIPGERYYIKVLAKNSVGWSEYSECNNYDNAETATCRPDVPNNVKPVAATWGSITYEGILPYSNGRPITEMILQYRVVQAFARGPWSKNESFFFDNPNDIQHLEEDTSKSSESKAAKKQTRQKILKVASGVVEETKLSRNTTIDVSSIDTYYYYSFSI
jgi:hypothetical protein